MCFLLSIFFQGCSGQEPTKEDVVGIWSNPDGSYIELKSDGNFIATNLSTKYFTLDEYKGEKFNGIGNWTLKKGKSFWEIYLGFNEISDKHYSYGHTILISGENGILENKPPWYLFLWKEEEGGDRYEFHKK